MFVEVELNLYRFQFEDHYFFVVIMWACLSHCVYVGWGIGLGTYFDILISDFPLIFRKVQCTLNGTSTLVVNT